MIEYENTTEEQVRLFWSTLGKELDSFDSTKSVTIDLLLKKAVFVKGVWRNEKLAGLGGLCKSFGFLYTFHIVKEEYYRQGCADEITEAFMCYARRRKLSILLASIFPWNTAIVKATIKQGYKPLFRGKLQDWLYIPLKPSGEFQAKIFRLLLSVYYAKTMFPVRGLRGLTSRFFKQLELRGLRFTLKISIVFLLKNIFTLYEYLVFLSGSNTSLRWKVFKYFYSIHRKIKCLHTEGELLRIADFILTNKSKGDIVECGTYNGGATVKLSMLGSLTGRRIIACDSFEGLPSPIAEDSKFFRKGEYRTIREEFDSNITTYGVPSSVLVIQGWFESTLSVLSKGYYILVFEDADLYSSVAICIDSLWKSLVTGGRMYTHEMLFPSTLKAYSERKLIVRQSGNWIANSNLGYVVKEKYEAD